MLATPLGTSMVPVAVGVSLNLESSTPEHSGLGPRIQELEISVRETTYEALSDRMHGTKLRLA